MSQWTAPPRPKDYAEHTLLTAILDGTYPPGSCLPGERDLASQLGVTRPTLREAIQRLARDGWLTVSHGKPTVVNNYWREGGLNVLGTLVEHSDHLPPNFVCQLLEVRLHLAPAYTGSAVARQGAEVTAFLTDAPDTDDPPGRFAAFDWQLHRRLTIWSGNPIYTLILNGFSGFYTDVATRYFEPRESRVTSHHYYVELAARARDRDAVGAFSLTQKTMQASIELWERNQAKPCAG